MSRLFKPAGTGSQLEVQSLVAFTMGEPFWLANRHKSSIWTLNPVGIVIIVTTVMPFCQFVTNMWIWIWGHLKTTQYNSTRSCWVIVLELHKSTFYNVNTIKLLYHYSSRINQNAQMLHHLIVFYIELYFILFRVHNYRVLYYRQSNELISLISILVSRFCYWVKEMCKFEHVLLWYVHCMMSWFLGPTQILVLAPVTIQKIKILLIISDISG